MSIIRRCKVKYCGKSIHSKEMCQKHYKRSKKREDPRVSSKPIEYVIDVEGCFNITSHYLDKDGYGRVSSNNKETAAHRLVYEEMYGDIPEGKVIRHTCDNPSCINPEHLKKGTQADNIRDRVNRGRNVRGETQGLSKLTEVEVKEIRKLANKVPRRILSSRYKVSKSTVGRIINKKTWKHI